VAVAVNPIVNKIYVANNGSSNITIIDGATNDTAIVSAGSGPQAIAVNPVTNKIYVANQGGDVTLIDGVTNTTAAVSAGTNPYAIAANPVANKIYVANNGSSNVTVITEQVVQPVPLTTSVTPLTNDEAVSPTASFNFTAASMYSPYAPNVQNLYYAVDTWQNGWSKATGSGSSYSGTTDTLTLGTHILYAFAEDGGAATSINTGFGSSPIIGAMTAYLFNVTTLSAPTLFSPADGATSQSTVLTLKINSSDGASGYHWQVSQNSGFTAIMVDDSVSGSDDTLKVLVLNPNTTYYWHVQSFNGSGLGAYTSTYSFTTGSEVSLAVQATDFTATSEVSAVKLSWQTKSEIQNTGFNIFRADSGTSLFTMVASYVSNDSLKGLGTSSTGRSYDFTDNKVSSGSTYAYKIQSVASDGVKQDLTTLYVRVGVPKAYALYQNYPNPFNPSTTIRFDLKQTSTVTLEIYNVLGQKVEYWSYGVMGAGRYEKSIAMAQYSSGVYYYRINAIGNDGQKFVSIKKAMLVK